MYSAPLLCLSPEGGAHERMSNRQMKLRGEHAPRHVPDGLNVLPAFKFSITQFTSIYLLEWLALPFIPKIHLTHTRTHTAQGVFFLQIKYILTHKGMSKQMCQVIESQCLSCANVCVLIQDDPKAGEESKREDFRKE